MCRSRLAILRCVCVCVLILYMVYEDTNVYDDIGITL